MLFKKKYICVKQHDTTDCGAACLVTICKQYGLKVPISQIREIAGTDKEGTNIYGLVEAATKLGFTAKGVKADKEVLLKNNIPFPAIAHVVCDGNLLHYVVIHEVNRNVIIIADPAKGLVRKNLQEFLDIWTGILVLMVPTARFEPGDRDEKLLFRFLKLLKPQYKLLTNIFLVSIFHTLLGILGAFYFKFLVDDILPYNLEKTLHIVSIGIITLYIFKVVLSAFRTHLLLYLSNKLDVYLILGYYSHVINLPMNFFGTRKVGEILSRLIDASKVREAISSAALTIMIDTLMLIAGAFILYFQSSFLFGITLILIPIYFFIVWAFRRPFEDVNREQMENNSALTSYIVESLNGIETIKAYNAETSASFETERRFVKLLRSIFKGGVVSNLQSSLKQIVQSVGGVVILWIGSYQVIKGEISVGQLLTYNALLAYFLDPIQNLINLQSSIQTALVAADRLGEILTLELEKKKDEDKKIKPATLKGTIELKNVDFRYGKRDLLLKNINMTIKKGEKIALVGESGSGKTTLAKLLLGFYTNEKGDLEINGNNIKDINISWLRKKISYISQSTFFFSGSIYENLCLGKEDEISIEEIVDCAKLTRSHDFINQLPLRYNTMLEENAANISGGQRQRLAITRALLKKPDILIMDEATSNLDSVTEKSISDAIYDICKDITVIIIAHRLSTIMKCDKIYVLNDGEIVESGNHRELIQLQGRYYELWNNQLPDKYLAKHEELYLSR